MNLHAAIPLGVVQTFSTAPAVGDWSTITNGGNNASFVDAATFDANAVQTNEASAIIYPLPTITADGTGAVGRYLSNATRQVILTRPTGIAFHTVMATVQNTSGGNLSSLYLAYDLGSPTPALASEDPELGGLRVFYSLTGAASSWTLVPELTSTNPGSLLGTLALGSWPANALLYVLFFDDNGVPGGDGSYSIDNFQAVTTVPLPVITVQPQSTNVVVARTIRLSVTATGIGLSYAWFKDGVPIDPLVNATAAQPTLIINNAQPGDSGEYRVTVANISGGVISSIANVMVSNDTVPPKFLTASEDPASLTGFRLTVDEPLCLNDAECGGDAALFFNWTIEEVEPPNIPLAINAATVTGTNIIFDTSARDPAKTYRIRAGDQGGFTDITDLFGNEVPLSQSITAAPSRIFVQGATYTGTQDAEIHSLTMADTPLGTATSVTVDLSSDDTGFAQALLRFDNIFGSEISQIPPGAQILEATLTLNQFDPGSPANLHRMLVTWDQATVTWNTMIDGVTADGIEAATASDGISINDAPNGPINFNVIAAVQAWADGQANYGWVFISTGTGGWDWDTSEGATPPRLSVVFLRRECLSPPGIVTHPVPQTVIEGAAFSVSCLVTGDCNATYQWTKDGANVPGANSKVYNVAAAVPGAGGSGGQYRLNVQNPNGTATSNPALVTVNPDQVRPVVLRVGNSNDTTIVVTFSKIMGASAGVAGNYTLNGVAASAAVLAADGRSVTLTTAPRTFPTAYSLSVAAVTDNRATPNVISPNPTVVPITTVQVVVPWNSAWQYNTNDQDAAPNWKSVPTAGLDATWLTGNALFGIETSAGIMAIFPTPIATPLEPNTNAPPNLITYYFRKDITLPALPAGAAYAINHLIDDGAVFYLDGVEIGRLNMVPAPESVSYTNKASTAGEAAFSSVALSASAGNHLLAVEVHQGGATTSSDMLFGAQVVIIPATPRLTISHEGTNAVVRWTADTKWSLFGSAAAVTGPYTPVGLPAANPLGFFSTPATQAQQFYRLNYIGP